MKECVIMHYKVSKLTPPRYFQGVRTPFKPQDLRPWLIKKLQKHRSNSRALRFYIGRRNVRS